MLNASPLRPMWLLIYEDTVLPGEEPGFRVSEKYTDAEKLRKDVRTLFVKANECGVFLRLHLLQRLGDETICSHIRDET